MLQPKIGTAHAAAVRYALTVTQFLAGRAFATVLLGIAGQQSLASVFAGLVLLFSRPVDIGDQVWIRSGAMGGELRGTVTELGLLSDRRRQSRMPACKTWPPLL